MSTPNIATKLAYSPSGYRFHPIGSVVKGLYGHKEPKLEEVESGHYVACLLAQ